MSDGAILVSDVVEDRHGVALSRIAPERPRVVLRGEQVDGDTEAIEIVFFSGDVYPDRTRYLAKALVNAPNLCWFHSFSAGVDHPWFQRLLEQGVQLTTSAGASAVPIAHTVMLYILALSRDLRGWIRDQERAIWNERHVVDLQGKLLGVVGVGHIGAEVARLGGAFGMRVIGLRRSPRGDEPCETWPLERLDELLARVDYLVLALPLNDASTRLLSAQRLAMMKPGAFVVNVGRGGLIDEQALVAALERGTLAGAGLDVFEVEPLPAESRLWQLANVIITPHSSGTNPGNNERACQIFLANLTRYQAGEPLRNQVG
jgi:phosphoglycerate dehydrogenase-like enzyme